MRYGATGLDGHLEAGGSLILHVRFPEREDGTVQDCLESNRTVIQDGELVSKKWIVSWRVKCHNYSLLHLYAKDS